MTLRQAKKIIAGAWLGQRRYSGEQVREAATSYLWAPKQHQHPVYGYVASKLVVREWNRISRKRGWFVGQPTDATLNYVAGLMKGGQS